MRDRCVFDVDVRVAPRLGHEPLSPAALDDGDRGRARSLLSAIDTEYGGLAARQVSALDDALR